MTKSRTDNLSWLAFSRFVTRRIVTVPRAIDRPRPIGLHSPTPLPDTGVRDRGVAIASPRRTQPGKRKPRKPRPGPTAPGVSLADIVASRLLMPPLKLFRKYKGKTLEATLLANGSVEFQGVPHASCSAAASTARSTITGQPMATNGWEFWQYVDGNGRKLTLADARNAYRTSGRGE